MAVANQSMMRAPSFAVPAETLVWVFSDVSGMRQSAFINLNCRVVTFAHDLHSRGHMEVLSQALQTQRPALVWIRLHGPYSGTGNRRDASRMQLLLRLAREQRQRGNVIIEGNMRSQAWNLHVLQHARSEFCDSAFRWCRLEQCDQDAQPCSAVIRVFASFAAHSMEQCLCRADSAHVTAKQLPMRARSAREALVVQSVA